MNNEEIRKRIKYKRMEKNISQATLAEKMSISQTAYHKIENGTTHLISDHLPKIAEILNLPEEELILGFDISKIQEILDEKDREIANLKAMLADKDKIIALQEELLKSRQTE